MKKFILNIFFFAIPILALFVVIESYVTFSSNTFTVKAKYLKKNLKNVEVLVLGSSHHQNAINPEYIDLKTINIAYGGQDIQLDTDLFFKYASQLNSLKMVILEYDYITFCKKVDKDYFRLSWYYRFYGIEPYDIPFKYKLSIYASSYTFFNNFYSNKLKSNSYKYILNESGFVINDFPGIFKDSNFDIKKINEEFRRNIDKIPGVHVYDNFEFNAKKINKIIDFCTEHNIKVILLSSPLFSNGMNFELGQKRKLMDRYCDSIMTNKNVQYFNFQNDERFSITDFKNYNHLNSEGAKKYSLILNDYLNVSESSNH